MKMIERIKYNFWLLLFIANTLVFLFFLYQAFSFTSVFAYRWVFFLSTPFFTSGIHLLIKTRSTQAEWLSVINFILIAMLIIYFNAIPTSVETYWPLFTIPIFNQLAINAFDVIHSGTYPYKWGALVLICVAWVLTVLAIAFNIQALKLWATICSLLAAVACIFLVVFDQIVQAKKN
jgi:hypothetical protein